MSEEKKAIELKEDDLEKVNGGFEIKEEVITTTTTYKIFEAGDCFQYNDVKTKVIGDHKIPIDQPQNIQVLLISRNGNTLQYSINSNHPYFSENNFCGNNMW